MDEVTSNALEWTLEEWVAQLHNIYGESNKSKTGLLIWANVLDDASTLAESVRRERYGDVSGNIAHIFAWYCSFVAKYTIATKLPANSSIKKLYQPTDTKDAHISNWILGKYPKVCPVCGENPCHCPSYRGEAEARKELRSGNFDLTNPKDWDIYAHWHMLGKFRAAQAKKHLFDDAGKLKEGSFSFPASYPVPSLEELVTMFLNIYAGANHDQPVGNICFHLLEEIGEVMHIVVALNNLSSPNAGDFINIKANGKEGHIQVNKSEVQDFLHKELRKELADVFSWLVALVNKLNYVSQAMWPVGIEQLGKTGGKLQRAPLTLTKMVYKRYAVENTPRLECPSCHSPSCKITCTAEKVAWDFLAERDRLTGIEAILTNCSIANPETEKIERGIYLGYNKETKKVRKLSPKKAK